MQVLLRKEVAKLGKIGDVVDVADGYARNYLLPNGLAARATPGAAREIEVLKRKEEARRRQELEGLKKLAEELSGMELSLAANATEEGRLFGSIGPPQISEELRRRGYPVEDKAVSLEEHIKECGAYEVTIVLYPGVKSKVKLSVVREEKV